MTMLWTWGCTPPADLPVGVLRVECNALFAIPVEQKPCLLQGRHPCQIARKLGEYVNVFHCLQTVWRTKRLRSSSHTRMFSSKCSNSKLHIFRSSSMPSFWWCFCVVATSSPCHCIGKIVDKCLLTSTLSLISPVVPSDSWFSLPSFMVCTRMWFESLSLLQISSRDVRICFLTLDRNAQYHQNFAITIVLHCGALRQVEY